ncbi:MAG: 30S ribosomal protein S2 [Thermoprotei archaeon]|nr:MAG: 30S ribosomal protein S2 [Thermoprotei archaeon]
MSQSGERVASSSIELLVPINVYLEAGVHIGTHICTKHMKRFVYKQRPEGPYVLDVRRIDERIRIAAKFIARYAPESVLAVSARQYGFTPVMKFAEFTGGKYVIGRFVPGTLTNPWLETYVEPDVLIVTDPRVDQQAIVEASKIGIPVVAIASTDAKLSYIDLVIPGNNKGRKSLAVIYWLLTRQVLRERGSISPDGELPVTSEAFETKVTQR